MSKFESPWTDLQKVPPPLDRRRAMRSRSSLSEELSTGFFARETSMNLNEVGKNEKKKNEKQNIIQGQGRWLRNSIRLQSLAMFALRSENGASKVAKLPDFADRSFLLRNYRILN